MELDKPLNVGDVIRVDWSNGAGYSIYRIEDDPGPGPHQLVLVREEETAMAMDAQDELEGGGKGAQEAAR